MAEEKKRGTGEIWVVKFTEESAIYFREQVITAAMTDPDAPIIIYIDSYGGSVDALAKMIDTLEQIPNPIITACLGKAMSCGAILLSHGHHRYCAPNSRILVHEVSGGSGGDVHDVHNDATEMKRLNEHFLGLLAKNCGLRSYAALRKKVRENDGRDIYLTPKQAVAFGLVDEIGTPGIIPHVAYELVTIEPPLRKDKIKNARLRLGFES